MEGNFAPEMINSIYDFLEKYSDLVNNNKWSLLYEKVDRAGIIMGTLRHPCLTKILFDSGINPIPYFERKTPFNFGFKLDFKNNSVIKITPNIKVISPGSFDEAKNIEAIYLPKYLEKILFAGFSGLVGVKIYYDGTEEDFRHVSGGISPSLGSSFLNTTGTFIFSDTSLPIKDYFKRG